MKRMNEEKLAQMARFIRAYVESHNGQSPRFAEILAHMGMSNSVGYRYLTVLRDRGMVEYNGRETLRIRGQEQMRVEVCRTPIYGSIPCGQPDEREQEMLGHLAIPREWAVGECYLLRASGDSMVDIGIGDGDLVLIRRTDDVPIGQVAAVLTENGTTLKRLCLDGDRSYLLAENRSYPDERRRIYPKQITVQGQAIKVIKNIR